MHEKFPLETTMPMPQTSFVQCNEFDNINCRFVLFKNYCYETNSAFYVFFFSGIFTTCLPIVMTIVEIPLHLVNKHQKNKCLLKCRRTKQSFT